ncbi:unnamed protein product [Ilex paraguariensis]|uniref:Uncharacterized protein n=1 Tax=Ilex paraguariensis TaxID=185542 RepID=A0ABC8SDZ2_9AQUA
MDANETLEQPKHFSYGKTRYVILNHLRHTQKASNHNNGNVVLETSMVHSSEGSTISDEECHMESDAESSCSPQPVAGNSLPESDAQ